MSRRNAKRGLPGARLVCPSQRDLSCPGIAARGDAGHLEIAAVCMETVASDRSAASSLHHLAEQVLALVERALSQLVHTGSATFAGVRLCCVMGEQRWITQARWPSRCDPLTTAAQRTLSSARRAAATLPFVCEHVRDPNSTRLGGGDEKGRDSFSRWDVLPTFCGFTAGARDRKRGALLLQHSRAGPLLRPPFSITGASPYEQLRPSPFAVESNRSNDENHRRQPDPRCHTNRGRSTEPGALLHLAGSAAELSSCPSFGLKH
jgi:hypothetical protein